MMCSHHRKTPLPYQPGACRPRSNDPPSQSSRRNGIIIMVTIPSPKNTMKIQSFQVSRRGAAMLRSSRW